MASENCEYIYCAKCGQQAAIVNKYTRHVISGAYNEGADGCNYCKKCFGIESFKKNILKNIAIPDVK